MVLAEANMLYAVTMFKFDELCVQYTPAIPMELKQTTEEVMPIGVVVYELRYKIGKVTCMMLLDAIADREVIAMVRLSYVPTNPCEKVAEQLDRLPIRSWTKAWDSGSATSIPIVPTNNDVFKDGSGFLMLVRTKTTLEMVCGEVMVFDMTTVLFRTMTVGLVFTTPLMVILGHEERAIFAGGY